MRTLNTVHRCGCPTKCDLNLNVSGAIGLLWPLGIPLIMRGLDGWRARFSGGLFSLVAMAALYAWAVIVVLLVLLLFQRPN